MKVLPNLLDFIANDKEELVKEFLRECDDEELEKLYEYMNNLQEAIYDIQSDRDLEEGEEDEQNT